MFLFKMFLATHIVTQVQVQCTRSPTRGTSTAYLYMYKTYIKTGNAKNYCTVSIVYKQNGCLNQLDGLAAHHTIMEFYKWY